MDKTQLLHLIQNCLNDPEATALDRERGELRSSFYNRNVEALNTWISTYVPNDTIAQSWPSFYSEWLLSNTLEYGADTAAEWLSTKNRTRADVYEVCLVSGISCHETIELADDIFICPPQDVPIATFRREWAAFLRREEAYSPTFVWDMRYPQEGRPTAAIYRRLSLPIPCKFEQEDLKKLTGWYIQDLCRPLTLVGPSSPLALSMWARVHDWHPTGPGGSAVSDTHEGSLPNPTLKLDEENGEKAREVVGLFLKNLQLCDKLKVSFSRLNRAIRQTSNVDKAIDLGIALEALLVRDTLPNDPISFKLRLRGALLSGDDPAERYKADRLLNVLYDARSKAVHTGHVANDHKLMGETLHAGEVLRQGTSLCANLLLAVMRRGSVPQDWVMALYGGPLT
jgi:hypothetical protein